MYLCTNVQHIFDIINLILTKNLIMIIATKNGVTRQFSEEQWGNMPANKFGWKEGEQSAEQKAINLDIIEKKMEFGKVVDVIKVVPDEIVINKKVNEIKNKPGRRKK